MISVYHNSNQKFLSMNDLNLKFSGQDEKNSYQYQYFINTVIIIINET